MLTEQELSATSLALIAQPALWPSLLLPGAASRAPAHEEPWTTYWATRLDASMEVEQARALYDAACTAFAERGDRVGELLCIASIIEGFYVDEGPLEPLDHWIAALCRCLPADGRWASIELEARVIACGVGILLRNPSHPLLPLWAARGASLVRQVKPGAGRLKLATFLAQYHLWRGEFGRTALIVDALPGLDMSGLLPGEALVWLETVANHARCAAQYDRGREAVDQALALLNRHGLRQHVYALHAHGASIALAAQDPDTAQRHIDAMRPVLDGGPQADQTHYWHFQAGLALLRGETARAVELARAAQDNSAEIGGPYRSAVHAMSLGQALLRAGDAGAALAVLRRVAGRGAAHRGHAAGLHRDAHARRLPASAGPRHGRAAGAARGLGPRREARFPLDVGVVAAGGDRRSRAGRAGARHRVAVRAPLRAPPCAAGAGPDAGRLALAAGAARLRRVRGAAGRRRAGAQRAARPRSARWTCCG
jgi:hypothetical protein